MYPVCIFEFGDILSENYGYIHFGRKTWKSADTFKVECIAIVLQFWQNKVQNYGYIHW